MCLLCRCLSLVNLKRATRFHISNLFLVAYNDIGKPAKDLLTKDYPVGGVKLEVKTTAPNGVVSKALQTSVSGLC